MSSRRELLLRVSLRYAIVKVAKHGPSHSDGDSRQMVPLRLPFLALLALARAGAAYAAMDCPAPPQNVAKEVVTETEANVSGLRSLVGGNLKNRTEVTAKNLFEKYPHADRVAVATLMMSVYCRQIDNSTALSDPDKLDRLQTVNQSIISMMTTGP